MRKRLTTAGFAAILTLSMAGNAFAAGWQKNDTGWWYGTNADNTTWYANEWQWIDGNGDGTAESYYFDANGYLYTNTTTPDGYTVNADGAWTENGVVQTKAVSGQTGNTANVTANVNTSGRYVEDNSLPNIVIPTNGYQGTYHLSRDVFESLVAQSPNKQREGIDFGNWIDNCYYTRDGEQFTLGIHVSNDIIRKPGKWMVDTSKPDAVNGKTNIRFLYDDGTWAGLGFHGMNEGANFKPPYDGFYKSQEAKLYYGGTVYYFSEDGYLMRNCYLEDDYHEGAMKIGCSGGWVDRR